MNMIKKRLAICKEISPFINKYKIQWIFLLFFKVGQKIPLLLYPLLFKYFIDTVISSHKISYLFNVIILYICLYILDTILKVTHRIIDNMLFNKITQDLRTELWKKYLIMPAYKFNNYETSDLIQRLNLDIDMMKFFLIGQIFDYITAIFSVIGSVYLMLAIEWHIALAACLLIPFSLILARKYKGTLEKLSEQDRHYMNQMEEAVQNINIRWKEVKANQLEEKEVESFETILNRICKNRKEKDLFLFRKNVALDTKIKLFDSLSIYVVGGILHFLTALPVGAVMACVSYFENVSADLYNILEMDSNLEWIKPSIDRVIEIIEIEADKEGYIECNTQNSNVEYEIKNLNFRYDSEAKDVLQNLNAKIEKSEKILIDGASGNGKSTLLEILSGNLNYKDGNICFRGKDLAGYSTRELQNYIRKIDHETYFMNITIKEFFQMAKRDVSNEEIKIACTHVNLWDDLKGASKELTYEFKIGENGSKLSGGQKQKLALARLFLINNKTILLDEAFSAIDVKDKVEILNKLFEHYRDDVIICVSHDLEIKAKFGLKILV